MSDLSPRPLFPDKHGFNDYEDFQRAETQERITLVAELLQGLTTEEFIDAEGKRFEGLLRRIGTADVATGSTCSGFIVSVDASTGAITATSASVSYSGPSDTGYTVPTWAGTGDPLTDSGGTVAATGTVLVWVKISYSATDSTFGTSWTLDDVEFDFGASRPANTIPSYNFSTNAWSGGGAHYADWATIVDRSVQSSFGGGILLKICSPTEVIVQAGCAI